MFSIDRNEEAELKKHQRRVAKYVELTIPQNALENGTQVMVTQVACNTPGCSPLETIIIIVFPRAQDTHAWEESEKTKNSVTQWIPGLPQSVDGGSFQAKILLPLSLVTQDYVLDALPPVFIGGRKSLENDYTRVRDQMINQIEQIMERTSASDAEQQQITEGKRLMANYLIQCLKEYIERDCTPQPHPVLNYEEQIEPLQRQAPNVNVIHGNIHGSGNFIVRRNQNDDPTYKPKENTMDWRRRKIMEKSVIESLSSASILEAMTEREHAPGIRKPGCPCCDPDNVSNVIDQMLSM